MTDLDLLLRAVLDSPDDDTVRLAYADEVQARGLPGDGDRAEFIRVQVAAGTRCHPTPGPPFGRYSERERELIALHPEWRDAVRGWVDPEGLLVFDRGFLHTVTCTGDDWDRHGDAILAAHPVRRVTFTGRVPRASLVYDRDGNVMHRTFRFAGMAVVVGQTPAGSADATLPFRKALSARWPRVPEDGWTFPPPPGSIVFEGGVPVGIVNDEGGTDALGAFVL